MQYYNYSYSEKIFFKSHFFHIVKNDSLPFFTSLSVGSLMISMVNYFHYECDSFFFKIYFFLFIVMLFDWFFMVNKEALNGFHTKSVQLGILKGFVLFICSEVMFFFSMFWSFFHFKLNPSMELDCVFPPLGISMMKMNCLPLFNTVLLVYSGLFLMNSLNSLKREDFSVLISSDHNRSTINLMMTLVLGSFFMVVQFYEYSESLFSFNDSCYGSVFFLLTGFHGFHVIIGMFFLYICLLSMRVSKNMSWSKWSIWDSTEKTYINLKGKDGKFKSEFSSFYFFSREFYSWKSLFMWMNYNNMDWDSFYYWDYLNYNNSIMVNFLGFKSDVHVGFICASWYWHFVDAVWMIVVSVIYSDIFLTVMEFWC